MSFGRAKRFVYKEPEITPSPADYVITTTLEKGCKIPKSPRFGKPAREDGSSSTCSRASSRCYGLRNSTPRSEKEYTTGCDDLDALKRTIVELNRKDIEQHNRTKKSIETRRKPFEANDKSMESSFSSWEYSNNFADQDSEPLYLPRCAGLVDRDYNFGSRSFEANANSSEFVSDMDHKFYFLEREEFIDDDLDSFVIPEKISYKFERLYNDLEEIQFNAREQNDCQSPRTTGLLENLDNEMQVIKNDVTRLDVDFNEREIRRYVEGTKYDNKQVRLPGSTKYEEINCIIKNSVQFIRNQFEMHGKSLKKETEEKIRRIFVDLFVTTERSTEQFQEYCTHTANHLSKRISRTLNIPSSVREPRSGDKHFATGAAMTPNDDDYADEDDDLDFTLKFGDTQERLELQESLLEALKFDLSDLKDSFCNLKC